MSQDDRADLFVLESSQELAHTTNSESDGVFLPGASVPGQDPEPLSYSLDQVRDHQAALLVGRRVSGRVGFSGLISVV